MVIWGRNCPAMFLGYRFLRQPFSIKKRCVSKSNNLLYRHRRNLLYITGLARIHNSLLKYEDDDEEPCSHKFIVKVKFVKFSRELPGTTEARPGKY